MLAVSEAPVDEQVRVCVEWCRNVTRLCVVLNEHVRVIPHHSPAVSHALLFVRLVDRAIYLPV